MIKVDIVVHTYKYVLLISLRCGCPRKVRARSKPTYQLYMDLYNQDPRFDSTVRVMPACRVWLLVIGVLVLARSNPPECRCENSQIALFGLKDTKTKNIRPETVFVTPTAEQNSLCTNVNARLATCRLLHPGFATSPPSCENVAGTPMLVLDAIAALCNMSGATMQVCAVVVWGLDAYLGCRTP